MLFGTWMEDARARGRARGIDYNDLACQPVKLTDHVQDRLAEACRDLETLYMRLPAAALSDPVLRERWENFRPEYIRQIRKAIDHLGAALTAVGCTGKELAEAGIPAPLVKKSDDPSDPEEGDAEPDLAETMLLPVPAPAPVGTDEEK